MATYTADDFYATFHHLCSSDRIAHLFDQPRWTFSDPKTKKPYDIRLMTNTGKIMGARKPYDDTKLMTLHEIAHEFVPRIGLPPNLTFLVKNDVDEVMILDIEKTCPPDIAAELLGTDISLYEETSMSGKGYHLIMPNPTNYRKFPVANNKRKLQHRKGWWEILLEHWITFTANPIPMSVRREASGKCPSWDEVFAGIAKEATEVEYAHVDTSSQCPNIPLKDTIITAITQSPTKKTLSDFDDDHSRFEMHVLGFLENKMNPIISMLESAQLYNGRPLNHYYSANEKAWLIFEAAKRLIEPRPKHNELRNGMPLLLSGATKVIGSRIAKENKDKAQSSQ